jgi:hypothetical protein
MSRRLLLAVLFGTLLVCGTMVRADEEVEVDDDDEEEEVEDEFRAHLLVRRVGEQGEKPSAILTQFTSCGWPRVMMVARTGTRARQ